MKLGDSFELADRTFKLIEICEEPNTGLVVIAEDRGVNTFKFTIPKLILDEMESFLFCQVCGDEFYSGLHACKGCHERASAKKKTSPGIDELAKRNAELQDQLEQITARRADAMPSSAELTMPPV